MMSLFALFIAGCRFMVVALAVVATGVIRVRQTGLPLALGGGRLDGADLPAPSIAADSPRAPARAD